MIKDAMKLVAVMNRDWWQEVGKQLGYPKCCIDSFCDLAHLDEPSRKLNGTGYIPCAQCNEKSEEDLVRVIKANRDPSLMPFPFEG